MGAAAQAQVTMHRQRGEAEVDAGYATKNG
jgi:hypothetical protein